LPDALERLLQHHKIQLYRQAFGCWQQFLAAIARFRMAAISVKGWSPPPRCLKDNHGRCQKQASD
jgi:hypothetical protein